MRTTERRQKPRATITIPVVEEFMSETQHVTAKNISEYGMCYCKPKDGSRCEKSNEVMLDFTLPNDSEPIRVLSWVVDEKPDKDNIETRVTFMFLQDKDEAKIRDYIGTVRTIHQGEIIAFGNADAQKIANAG